ncbi:MAG TPA: hypothetical protein VJ792_01135 [Candidatus Nitrosotalea sp.]|nr:hypothetical protein [Candidatus Nitrosotalea sp.]
MSQDLNPLPWGAQDRYQAHFIVRAQNPVNFDDFLARTKVKTSGHFAAKKAVDIEWVGGNLASLLNSDTELKSMILKLPLKDSFIWIEPTKNGMRIHGKWKSSQELGVTKELFEVYNQVASHIKKIL